MGLFPYRQQELQRVFLAKISTREELSWVLEKEHQREAGDGQLGQLGCLQLGACSLGRSRLFLYQCLGAPFANALLLSQAFLCLQEGKFALPAPAFWVHFPQHHGRGASNCCLLKTPSQTAAILQCCVSLHVK